MEATIKETKSTSAQRVYIQKLCKYDQNVKEAVVFSSTNGRTESLRETTFREADLIIKQLGGKFAYFAYFDRNNQQHRYIMSLMHQLGWTANGNPDLNRLSQWLQSNRSPVRKPLKQMSKTDLTKIISALESILNKQS